MTGGERGASRSRKRGRPPNPILRAAKHARMLAAAMDLFIEQGYEHASVERIAKSSGQSKGAFYWYFKDKEDCLNQIAETLVSKIEEIVRHELGKSRRASERLSNLTDLRTWNTREIARYTLLVDSLIFSRSRFVNELGTKVAGQIWKSLHRTLVATARDALLEAGRDREASEDLFVEHWACAMLACYNGLFMFHNRRYFGDMTETEAMAKVLRRIFVTPLTGGQPSARASFEKGL
jgi:AcrR family transcriptional regulator